MKRILVLIMFITFGYSLYSQDHVVYQTPYDPMTRFLDNTLSVGTTQGSAGVSGGGGATYQIPIFACPGTAGLQPNVSIVYNSQSGNGLLGYGWNLTGLSVISRSGNNLYNDDNIRTIQFDANDKLCIDGNRLIAISGTYGANGTEYRTENETFNKIVSTGNVNGFPDKFTVYTKDGTEIEYGGTADSKIEAQGRSDIMMWYINKIKDIKGNYLKFTYHENNVTGEVWIESIDYTGNETTGLQPYNSLKFYYATRSDWETSYIFGSQFQSSVVLQNIKAYNGATVVREYQFLYNFDIYSRLAEIKEYGTDHIPFNSTLIGWNSPSTPTVTYPSTSITGTKLVYGDFNGDGKTDIASLSSDKTTTTIFLMNSDGKTFTNSSSIALYSDDLYAGDFNGDGLCDLVFKANKPYNVLYRFYKSLGNSFSAVTVFRDGVTFTGETLADFDGDGKAEFLYKSINANNYNTFNIIKDGTSSIVVWTDDYDVKVTDYKILQVSDFNGDGKSDIMFSPCDLCWSYSIFELVNNNLVSKFQGSFPANSSNLQFGDFNGDGKTDYIVSVPGPKLQFGFFNGKQFTNGYPYYDYPNLPTTLTNPIIKDFNGDGKSEILDILSSAQAKLYSVFNTVTESIPITTAFSTDCRNYNDFNGDGMIECYTGSNLVTIYENDQRHLLDRVVNGFNRYVKFSYQTIAQPSVYTKGTGAVFPVQDIQFPIFVVNSVTSDIGMDQTIVTNYSYEGAKMHILGRGFLGFSKITALNTANSIKTVDNYALNTTYYALFPASSQLYSGTKLITERIDTMGITEYGNKRIFAYKKSTTTKNYDLNSQALYSTLYKAFSYDTDGNLTLEQVNTNGVGYSKVENTYINSGGYCLNRLSRTKLTKSRPNEADYVSITDFGYANGILNQKTTEPGNAKQLITTYQYNNFGNITNILTSKDGINGRSETMEYDSYGRFMTKKSNVLGHYLETNYDERFGVPTLQKDHNNLSTGYTYDSFGRLATTTSPDNITSTLTYTLITKPIPRGVAYSITKSTPGAPTVKEFFDKLGRTIRTSKTGFDGRDIYIDTHYNINSQVDEVTLSHWYNETGTDKKVITYDALGRVLTETAPGVNLSYSYNGLSATANNLVSGLSTTKTADASGSLVSSSDAGGTITYGYLASGQVKTISVGGSSLSMSYDQFGNQTRLFDPNTGGTRYEYNEFGEIISQTDTLNRVTTIGYDQIGRISTSSENGFNSTYTYKPNGQVDNVATNNNVTYSYTYDSYGRIASKSENVNGTIMTTSFTYDSYGRIQTVTYPSGFAVTYSYQNGYLKEIKRNDTQATIWQATALNARDQLTSASFGNGLTMEKGYNTLGLLETIVTGGGSIQNLQYGYDGKNNMQYRTDKRHGNIQENFGYDNLNRLSSISIGSNPAKTLTYASNGNIASSTDVGTYTYDAVKPNAVASVSNGAGIIGSNTQAITYTAFNKINTISDGANSATFTYGPDHNRKLVSSTIEGTNITRYYSDSYEKETKNGTTRELNYISAYGQLVAIAEKTGSTLTLHYVHTDHLGSVNVLTNQNGGIEQELSYDAWGNRRDPNTWQNLTSVPTNLITLRGFTGHEHMDDFKLINMGGRAYDPTIGRFLNPDNYVQAADFSQSYNRYSYCFNNPLSFTDPSGWQLVPLSVDNNSYIFPIPGEMAEAYKNYEFPFTHLRTDNGTGSGEYHYNYYLGFYQNGEGEYVPYSEVFLNYINPNSYASISAKGDFRINMITHDNYGGTGVSFQDKNGNDFYLAGNSSGRYYFSTLTPGASLPANFALNILYRTKPSGGGDNEGLREHAKFLAESGEKYFALTGEAFHNDLYWMQKNGTIRLTSNIGNNYLLKRSYSLVGQTVQSTKIIAEGLLKANIAYAVTDYVWTGISTQSIPSLGKGVDLFFTSVAVIPGGGWAVSGAYWITSMGFYLTTGKTLGEHIDEWSSGE